MLNFVPFRQTLLLLSSGLIALGRVLVALVLTSSRIRQCVGCEDVIA
jgi:hypothetical protein